MQSSWCSILIWKYPLNSCSIILKFSVPSGKKRGVASFRLLLVVRLWKLIQSGSANLLRGKACCEHFKVHAKRIHIGHMLRWHNLNTWPSLVARLLFKRQVLGAQDIAKKNEIHKNWFVMVWCTCDGLCPFPVWHTVSFYFFFSFF